MHSIMMIGGGLVLLGLFVLIGRLLGGDRKAMTRSALMFIPVWLVGAGINMYIGVTQAGYTFVQELPFFVLVFGVPAAAALGIRWYVSRQEER